MLLPIGVQHWNVYANGGQLDLLWVICLDFKCIQTLVTISLWWNASCSKAMWALNKGWHSDIKKHLQIVIVEKMIHWPSPCLCFWISGYVYIIPGAVRRAVSSLLGFQFWEYLPTGFQHQKAPLQSLHLKKSEGALNWMNFPDKLVPLKLNWTELMPNQVELRTRRPCKSASSICIRAGKICELGKINWMG